MTPDWLLSLGRALPLSPGTTEQVVPVVFPGDLSAARLSSWVPASGFRSFSIELSWPAGVVGTIGLQVCNHGIRDQPGAPYPVTFASQPNGSAGKVFLDEIASSAGFLAISWAPGIGNSGAGAHLANYSGSPGSAPIAVLKRG